MIGTRQPAAPRPDYGIDAPGLVRGFAAAAAAGGLCAAAAVSPWPGGRWAVAVSALAGVAAVYSAGMAGLMVYWSRVAKLRERGRLLGLVEWAGTERVLDVGCGRGLMMIGAAGRLTAGRAVGIDIWLERDQAGNSPEAVEENARRAGVLDRVEVRTADMRRLPFEDGSFDVVLSHWAVHNLDAEADRRAAVREMARVLKPGGSPILADIRHHAAYAAELSSSGMEGVRLVGTGLLCTLQAAVSFGSFRPAAVVAVKPADGITPPRT